MIKRKSNTRLTLSLDIIRKIKSGAYTGYHELGIVKHQVTLHDTITVEENRSMVLECDNEMVPCDGRNICWKAAELVKRRYGIDKNVRIAIEKRIPVMGGLAGGSANAATVIFILDQLWELELSKVQKKEIGRELGMDVPFFFEGGTAFDTETTGLLQKVSPSLQFVFVLAQPPFGVSTGQAYGGIDYDLVGQRAVDTEQVLAALVSGDRIAVLKSMHNDFELSVFTKYPALLDLREKMLAAGCEQAVMSGSGSTMVGVVPDLHTAQKVRGSLDCNTIVCETL